MSDLSVRMWEALQRRRFIHPSTEPEPLMVCYRSSSSYSLPQSFSPSAIGVKGSSTALPEDQCPSPSASLRAACQVEHMVDTTLWRCFTEELWKSYQEKMSSFTVADVSSELPSLSNLPLLQGQNTTKRVAKEKGSAVSLRGEDEDTYGSMSSTTTSASSFFVFDAMPVVLSCRETFTSCLAASACLYLSLPFSVLNPSDPPQRRKELQERLRRTAIQHLRPSSAPLRQGESCSEDKMADPKTNDVGISPAEGRQKEAPSLLVWTDHDILSMLSSAKSKKDRSKVPRSEQEQQGGTAKRTEMDDEDVLSQLLSIASRRKAPVTDKAPETVHSDPTPVATSLPRLHPSVAASSAVEDDRHRVAYIFFTSGSTGPSPKGVMASRANLIAYYDGFCCGAGEDGGMGVQAHHSLQGRIKREIFLTLSTPYFDPSIGDMLCTFLSRCGAVQWCISSSALLDGPQLNVLLTSLLCSSGCSLVRNTAPASSMWKVQGSEEIETSSQLSEATQSDNTGNCRKNEKCEQDLQATTRNSEGKTHDVEVYMVSTPAVWEQLTDDTRIMWLEQEHSLQGGEDSLRNKRGSKEGKRRTSSMMCMEHQLGVQHQGMKQEKETKRTMSWPCRIKVFLGGEAIPARLAELWAPVVELFSIYGVTEATIYQSVSPRIKVISSSSSSCAEWTCGHGSRSITMQIVPFDVRRELMEEKATSSPDDDKEQRERFLFSPMVKAKEMSPLMLPLAVNGFSELANETVEMGEVILCGPQIALGYLPTFDAAATTRATSHDEKKEGEKGMRTVSHTEKTSVTAEPSAAGSTAPFFWCAVCGERGFRTGDVGMWSAATVTEHHEMLEPGVNRQPCSTRIVPHFSFPGQPRREGKDIFLVKGETKENGVAAFSESQERKRQRREMQDGVPLDVPLSTSSPSRTFCPPTSVGDKEVRDSPPSFCTQPPPSVSSVEKMTRTTWVGVPTISGQNDELVGSPPPSLERRTAPVHRFTAPFLSPRLFTSTTNCLEENVSSTFLPKEKSKSSLIMETHGADLNPPRPLTSSFSSSTTGEGTTAYRAGLRLLGRLDYQIKLNGQRVSLEEVERTLAVQFEEVLQCCCCVAIPLPPTRPEKGNQFTASTEGASQANIPSSTTRRYVIGFYAVLRSRPDPAIAAVAHYLPEVLMTDELACLEDTPLVLKHHPLPPHPRMAKGSSAHSRAPQYRILSDDANTSGEENEDLTERLMPVWEALAGTVLPPFMVPRVWLVVEPKEESSEKNQQPSSCCNGKRGTEDWATLPLTATGKLHRRCVVERLQEASRRRRSSCDETTQLGSHSTSRRTCSSSASRVYRVVEETWRKLFGLERTSSGCRSEDKASLRNDWKEKGELENGATLLPPHTNFYHLGGDSLAALKVTRAVYFALGGTEEGIDLYGHLPPLFRPQLLLQHYLLGAYVRALEAGLRKEGRVTSLPLFHAVPTVPCSGETADGDGQADSHSALLNSFHDTDRLQSRVGHQQFGKARFSDQERGLSEDAVLAVFSLGHIGLVRTLLRQGLLRREETENEERTMTMTEPLNDRDKTTVTHLSSGCALGQYEGSQKRMRGETAKRRHRKDKKTSWLHVVVNLYARAVGRRGVRPVRGIDGSADDVQSSVAAKIHNARLLRLTECVGPPDVFLEIMRLLVCGVVERSEDTGKCGAEATSPLASAGRGLLHVTETTPDGVTAAHLAAAATPASCFSSRHCFTSAGCTSDGGDALVPLCSHAAHFTVSSDEERRLPQCPLHNALHGHCRSECVGGAEAARCCWYPPLALARLTAEWGTPFRVRDYRGQTLMHFAARAGHVEAVWWLLHHDTRCSTPNGISLPSVPGGILPFLEHSLPPSSRSPTAVGLSCDRRRADPIASMESGLEQLRERDKWQRTPAHWAALHGHVMVLEVMLEYLITTHSSPSINPRADLEGAVTKKSCPALQPEQMKAHFARQARKKTHLAYETLEDIAVRTVSRPDDRLCGAHSSLPPRSHPTGSCCGCSTESADPLATTTQRGGAEKGDCQRRRTSMGCLICVCQALTPWLETTFR